VEQEREAEVTLARKKNNALRNRSRRGTQKETRLERTKKRDSEIVTEKGEATLVGEKRTMDEFLLGERGGKHLPRGLF